MQDGRQVRQVSEYQCEVTLYKGNPATNIEIAEQMERLRKNFTQRGDDFYAMLIGELISDRWTAERIKDAVTHVLMTKTGGFISIADIFSFDRPMKLYNYSGYVWLITNHLAQDKDSCGEKSDFGRIKIDGKVFYYLKKDLPINTAKIQR